METTMVYYFLYYWFRVQNYVYIFYFTICFMFIFNSFCRFTTRGTLNLLFGNYDLWACSLTQQISHHYQECIYSISFSNKGSRYLCSGGSGHIVRIWDLQRKRCIKWLSGHTDTITGVMYNCKDEHLASISMKGDLILHNLASGARAAELSDPNGQVNNFLLSVFLCSMVMLSCPVVDFKFSRILKFSPSDLVCLHFFCKVRFWESLTIHVIVGIYWWQQEMMVLCISGIQLQELQRYLKYIDAA